MSFYSSLIVFYPGRPPLINIRSLRAICDGIRALVSVSEDQLEVKIRYYTPDNPSSVMWNDLELIGTASQNLWDPNSWEPIPWDHEQKSRPWQELWPTSNMQDVLVDEADITFDSMPEALSKELTASRGNGSYIIPTEASLSISPVFPMMLDDNLPADKCYGGLSISFSGMGYFTWQPLTAYWEVARRGIIIQDVLQLCREMLPAPASANLDVLKECLGEMFLNQEEYQLGDWIVSVSESG